MEPGLKLLIQLALEFAPVISNLVQKQSSDEKAIAPSSPSKKIPKLIEPVSHSTSAIDYLEGWEKASIESQNLAIHHSQLQFKIANQEQIGNIKNSEIQQLFNNWPLRLYPSQILNLDNYERKPLKIFLAPPHIESDRFITEKSDSLDIESQLAEGLRDFLNHNYSLQSPTRPTEFLAGAWDSKKFHSESSIKALFMMLKTEPILILESELEGDNINLRIAYWGLEAKNYYYQTIYRLPYKQILEESAKNRAREWRKIKDELISLGESLEDIQQMGGDNVTNLEILEKSEKWQNQGIDISKLCLKYQINHQDIDKLSQVLTVCHCLVAAWVTDAYHLMSYDVAPLLPEVLPKLLHKQLDITSLRAIAQGYQQLYHALEIKHREWIPDLALQLARSLSHLSDGSLAQEQIDYSLNTWLQLRQVPPEKWQQPLKAMGAVATLADREYVQKLEMYFQDVGDNRGVSQTQEVLQAIANYQPAAYTLCHTLTGHKGKITSITITPNGETLVSGCTDKTIKLWDITTGKAIRSLSENTGEISSLAISPDGNFLAVGSRETPKSNVKVWELQTGKLIHTLLGHHKPVNVVAISPVGSESPLPMATILASGSNKIKIWNLHTGDRISTLWHSSAVNAVAIADDGKVLVSGTRDQKIKLWNPLNGEPLLSLNSHTAEVNAVAIATINQEQMIYSGSSDTTIKIWRLKTGKLAQTLTGHTNAVTCLAISNSHNILVSGSADKTVKIWDLATGKLLHTLTGHTDAVNSVAVSPHGKWLASGSSDKTIKIWQIGN